MVDNRIFEPDGRAIPYAVEGEGPAVVLIAGQGLDISYLAVLARLTAETDFRVVRVGSRRPGATPATIADLVQDVVDVMDHLDITDAWVGGHAFGGAIARELAIAQHDRVNGVMLLGVDDASANADALAAVEIPANERDADSDTVLGAARAGWVPSAPAQGIPVLVIQGTDDTVNPPANGEKLQEAAPDRVSVVRIDGGGYLFPDTHVGATSWAVEDYLDWD